MTDTVTPILLCPQCGMKAHRGIINGREGWACLICRVEMDVPTNSPAAPVRRRTVLERCNDLAESEVVTTITTYVEGLGGNVWRVGQRKARNSGTTVGIPDLHVWLPAWPRHFRLPVEVKKPGGGDVRPEQQQIADAGHSIIVDSLPAFVAALAELTNTPNTERRTT